MTRRQRLANWLESPPIQNAIIGVIIFNAILLGMETSPDLMASFGGYPPERGMRLCAEAYERVYVELSSSSSL